MIQAFSVASICEASLMRVVAWHIWPGGSSFRRGCASRVLQFRPISISLAVDTHTGKAVSTPEVHGRGFSDDPAALKEAAVLVEGAVDAPALSQATVGSDRLAVLVRPDHPWATRSRLAADDLAATPWVLREAGSAPVRRWRRRSARRASIRRVCPWP